MGYQSIAELMSNLVSTIHTEHVFAKWVETRAPYKNLRGQYEAIDLKICDPQMFLNGC